MIEWGHRARPPRILSEEEYRALNALDWNTSHTRRLREGVGDDRLCCAYDPNPAREHGPCWLISRLMPTQVGYHYGRKVVYSETFMFPMLIDEWRNEDGTPRSITDPRLIATVMRSDTQRSNRLDPNPAINRARLESERAIEELARDDRLRKAMAALADHHGVSYHRPLGSEGGKISTSSIWRTGAGSRQPVIYTASGAPLSA